jgi:hypothetical protein
LATNFTPLNGEIIIYDEDDNYNYKRIKIGNGETNVNDLPFIDGPLKKQLEEHVHSWNDLQDKPFYTTKGPDNIVLEEITLEGFIEMQDPIYSVLNQFYIELIEDKLYKVIWDQTEYECIFTTSLETGLSYLGNYNYTIMQPGGDIPFCIIIENDNIYVAVDSETAQSSHTIKIIEPGNEIIVPIDEKFISNIHISKVYIEDTEVLEDVVKMGLYEPVGTEDGNIYVDENGSILTL